MRIQCATCTYEPMVIDAVSRMYPTQDEFNTHYLKLQDMARYYKCRYYLAVFVMRRRV